MDTIKCPNCGAEIAATSTFCQYCGTSVSAQPQQPQQPQQQPPFTPPPYNQQPPQPPYGQPPFGQAPYGQPGMPPVPPGYVLRSRMAAGLLGIFLGSLGIHNFYLGNQKRALIQLLVSLLTCGIGAVAMEIWGIIEGIQILTGSINVDGQGFPLRD